MLIEPLLPPRPLRIEGRRPRLSDQAVLNGIVLALRPGWYPAALVKSRANSAYDQAQFQINSGYAVHSSLGSDAALPVFTLNPVLLPQSADTWDRLAESRVTRTAKALRLEHATRCIPLRHRQPAWCNHRRSAGFARPRE